MFGALSYFLLGACLSSYVAGRYIPNPSSYEIGYRPIFIIAGTVLWPLVLPAFFAFRAGKGRVK